LLVAERAVARQFAQSYIVSMRSPLLAALLALFLPASLLAQTDSPDATFDTPIEKKVVDFGLSSGNPPGGQNMRIKLSCYIYASFMIKEYNDKGMKGAEWMSITPITGQQAPPCSREHGPGEKVFKEEGDERLGYFRGVKGDYVFFTAADGINGGMPFSVHDSNTGKVAFADSAYWGGMWNKPPEPSPFNDLRVTSVPGQPLTLTYLRVVATECDLHLWKKDACWGRVRREFGIKDAQMPTCTGYDNIDTRTSLPLLTRSRFRCQSRPWSKRSQVR